MHFSSHSIGSFPRQTSRRHLLLPDCSFDAATLIIEALEKNRRRVLQKYSVLLGRVLHKSICIYNARRALSLFSLKDPGSISQLFLLTPHRLTPKHTFFDYL